MTITLRVRRLLFFSLAVAACWPLGPWLIDRWFSWERMWFQAGLLATALVVWIVRMSGARRGDRPDHAGRSAACAPLWLFTAAGFFSLHACFHDQMPLLFGYVLLATGFSSVLLGLLPDSCRRESLGLFLLILLALPVMPTVQYLFGYPLRVAVAEVSSFWLGGDVGAVGTGLVSGGRTFFVDAPCSGLSILFTALVLAAATALVLRLDPLKTLLLVLLAVGIAFLGNVTRAVGLVVLESLTGGNGFLHEGVGLINFALCAVAIVWAGTALQRKELSRLGGCVQSRPGRGHSKGFAPGVVFVLACLGAFVTPFAGRTGEAAAWDRDRILAWPETWNGERLTEMPLDKKVSDFLGIFPGRMAEFQVGGGEERLFLRWTPIATRKLHPAEGCFGAMGGEVTRRPAVRDNEANRWSAFHVRMPDGEEFFVRQCYFALVPGASGAELNDLISGADSWPDASAWYWAAALGGSEIGSTLAVTVAGPDDF